MVRPAGGASCREPGQAFQVPAPPKGQHIAAPSPRQHGIGSSDAAAAIGAQIAVATSRTAARAIRRMRPASISSPGRTGTLLAEAQRRRPGAMLKFAWMFLLLSSVSAFLADSGLAGASLAPARFLAFLFAVLFLVFLALAVSASRRLICPPAPPAAERPFNETASPASNA